MASRPTRRQFLGRTGVVLASAAAAAARARAAANPLPPQGLARGDLKAGVPVDELGATLARAIPDLLAKHAVPGVQVALIRDAKVAWTGAFGVRDTATGAPVTDETVFEAASLSKPTFGFYALKLCEQAVIDLDAPLTEYREELLIPDEPRLEQITARLVLSHTSGLPHGRAGRKLALRTDPKKQFFYSATGLDYLQAIVEHVTKTNIVDFMRTHVLEPFAMSSSSFAWQERYEQLAAKGYDRDGKPGKTWNETFFRVWTDEQRAAHLKERPEERMPSAAAGMYTTATDFARFLIANLEPGKTEHHLSDEMTQEMLTPQVQVIPGVHWGLGWGLQATPAAKSFWHWGDWGIYRHFAVAYPRERLGLVVLTNGNHGYPMYTELVPLAIGGEHPAFRYLGS
jgi:CubicO group peptidase (beta-lactamase class C family)